jgi:arsenate reductase
LVLCTGNSARSQTAEGLLRSLGGAAYQVHSAGTAPKGVNPLAIQAMDELGIDLRGHTSKHLSVYLEDPWDFVLTVCDNAAEACPLFPGGGERIHWSFTDPADPAIPEAERLAEFRRVRDEIAERLRAWLAQR